MSFQIKISKIHYHQTTENIVTLSLKIGKFTITLKLTKLNEILNKNILCYTLIKCNTRK